MRHILNQIKALLPYSLKHRIRLWLQNSWPLQRLRYAFHLRVRKVAPIIIFQVGKVGSSSVHHSLKQAGVFASHHHTLSPDVLRHSITQLNTSDRFHLTRLKIGLWLHKHVISSGHPVKIITVTREPIAAMVSAYFQTLDLHTGVENVQENLTIEDLLRHFYDQYVDNTIWHDWYDREFKLATGIDIYAYPFDPAVGYGRIQERHYDVLLLRLETPDGVKEKAIAEFLDLPTFKLINVNVGAEKGYGEKYTRFKQQVSIPLEILNANYESRHMRHFYTPAEIDKFRANWARTD